MSSSSSSLHRTLASPPGWLKFTIASFPFYIWARDSLFSVYRVQGSSMEPALHPGDRVLVRKCDPGVILESLLALILGGDARDTERARLVRYEKLQGVSDHVPTPRLYQCPPLAMSGHIVVYKDPMTAFPSQYCIKRVVGIGGQWMKETRRLEAIPPYHLYVEGDNLQNSGDSRKIGPVSKNLLVGVAEYIVWPPSRWGKLERKPMEDEDGKVRAFWP